MGKKKIQFYANKISLSGSMEECLFILLANNADPDEVLQCVSSGSSLSNYSFRASNFFQDLWADVTHVAKNGVLFSEMMGPSITN